MSAGSGIDTQALFHYLMVLFMDPGSNLTAALVLYAIIAMVVAIMVIVAILFVISAPDGVTADHAATPAPTEGSVLEDATEHRDVPQPDMSGERLRRKPQAAASRPAFSPAARLVAALAFLGAAGIGSGYVTSSEDTCTGCHVVTGHDLSASADDPHVSVTCVACHEPGGAAGRYLGDVPARALHVADGIVGGRLEFRYGVVSRSACTNCHERALEEIVFDEGRGLRMSHDEPLAASARCIDCHTRADGVIAAFEAGMTPCLGCHDADRASAECSTCHDRNAAAAARPRTVSFAKEQITSIGCGGCHDESRQCDECHGARMPHSVDFMRYSHARAAAVDLWYDAGRTCGQCHTPTRRPCTKCHSSMLGNGHGPVLALIHRQSSEQRCNSCHAQWSFAPGRDFCADLCHSEAALEHSAR